VMPLDLKTIGLSWAEICNRPRSCRCLCIIQMEDEFEDFSVSSPFEALVADIQEVPESPPYSALLSLITLSPFVAGSSQMATTSELPPRRHERTAD
jgi:hypothetical protein